MQSVVIPEKVLSNVSVFDQNVIRMEYIPERPIPLKARTDKEHADWKCALSLFKRLIIEGSPTPDSRFMYLGTHEPSQEACKFRAAKN